MSREQSREIVSFNCELQSVHPSIRLFVSLSVRPLVLLTARFSFLTNDSHFYLLINRNMLKSEAFQLIKRQERKEAARSLAPNVNMAKVSVLINECN